MAGVDRLVDATTRWYLAHDDERTLEERIAAGEAPFARLVGVLPEIGGDEWRAQRRDAADDLVRQGRAGGRRVGARVPARADAGA